MVFFTESRPAGEESWAGYFAFEAEVLRPFMENLAQEVQRALQFFFTSTPYHSVDHVLLAGGSAVIPGLEQVINERAQVPASVANPFAAMQTSPRIQLKRLMAEKEKEIQEELRARQQKIDDYQKQLAALQQGAGTAAER